MTDLPDLTSIDWSARAGEITFCSEAFIDGQWVAAQSGATFDVVNPATDTVLASVAACNTEDVDAAVAAARRAFDDGRWSKLSAGERGAILIRFATLIEQHAEELATLVTLEMGKACLLYTSPSPRDRQKSRMPSSA